MKDSDIMLRSCGGSSVNGKLCGAESIPCFNLMTAWSSSADGGFQKVR